MRLTTTGCGIYDEYNNFTAAPRHHQTGYFTGRAGKTKSPVPYMLNRALRSTFYSLDPLHRPICSAPKSRITYTRP